MTKPFIKWVGGKTQLLEKLLPRIPESYNDYHEPMVGGGALFFRLKEEGLIGGNAHISDLNPDLIETYTVVRDHLPELLERLHAFAEREDSNTRKFFEKIRARLPENLSLADRAARFIYLNKTCFNGLYRVNKSGGFNVPFGDYKAPRICDEPTLRECSRVLQGVDIQCMGYQNILEQAKKNDFVYFDPPYIPLSETENFVSFTKDGFNDRDHCALADVFGELSRRGVKVMLSNSDTAFTRELYQDYSLEVVGARRSVNRDGTKRGRVNEVIVRNYR